MNRSAREYIIVSAGISLGVLSLLIGGDEFRLLSKINSKKIEQKERAVSRTSYAGFSCV